MLKGYVDWYNAEKWYRIYLIKIPDQTPDDFQVPHCRERHEVLELPKVPLEGKMVKTTEKQLLFYTLFIIKLDSKQQACAMSSGVGSPAHG